VLAQLIDALSWLLLGAGGFFCVVGGLGLVFFPDFYIRVHAAGVTDTLGAALLLSGLFLQAGFGQVAVKLVLVGVFLLATSPIATHALVKAAYARGLSLKLDIPSEAAEPGEEVVE
jgi:multicomponent Na+:H+ antiporter subunit G